MATVASLSESIQISIVLQRREDRLGVSMQPIVQQKSVGFCKQVLLVLVVCGMEMCITFEQIYQILILQYLGLPMSLVSLNGIICGVASMTTIPIIGYITGGGSNPKRRRMMSLFAGMVMFQIGLVLLLISGLIKISLIQELLHDIATTTISPTTVTKDFGNSTEHKAAVLIDGASENPLDAFVLISPNCGNFSKSACNQTNLTINRINQETSIEEGIPFNAYLAICGFAFIDIGWDSSASITRAYILESVPKFQHVKLLVMATIVQSASGTIFALLGVFDISYALGRAFLVDGTSAVLIFFCIFLFLVVTCGFTSTTLTGHYLTKNQDKTDGKTESRASSLKNHKIITEKLFHRNNKFESDNIDSADHAKIPLLRESSQDNNYLAMNMSSSFRSSLLSYEGSTKSGRTHFSHKLHRSVSTEDKSHSQALRSSYSVTTHQIDNNNFDDSSFISSLNHKNDGFKTQPKSTPVDHTGSADAFSKEKQETNNKTIGSKTKKKLAILATSSFFTVGESMSFLYYASNALTIGIFHGDPTALPGTEGKKLYDDGLRTAALGNLTLYILFTVTSLTNHKLLDVVDEKNLFFVFQLVFLIPLSVLLAIQCIEAYFATVLMFGLFRHIVCTLTYVMASKISQESGGTTNKTNLGKIMSLLGFLTPAHYLILSCIMGPLLDSTGNVWIPLAYSLGCGCVSALVLSSLFIVK